MRASAPSPSRHSSRTTPRSLSISSGSNVHVLRPVLEDEERAVDDRRILGRNLQLEDGLVEAGVRVDVRAEAHADRLHERDDPLIREVLRAVERHVLDHVGEPALVLVLEDRAGADDEPELGAVARRLVGADVIAQAVRQRADGDPRIDGNLLRKRYRRGAARRGELIAGGRGRSKNATGPPLRRGHGEGHARSIKTYYGFAGGVAYGCGESAVRTERRSTPGRAARRPGSSTAPLFAIPALNRSNSGRHRAPRNGRSTRRGSPRRCPGAGATSRRRESPTVRQRASGPHGPPAAATALLFLTLILILPRQATTRPRRTGGARSQCRRRAQGDRACTRTTIRFRTPATHSPQRRADDRAPSTASRAPVPRQSRASSARTTPPETIARFPCRAPAATRRTSRPRPLVRRRAQSASCRRRCRSRAPTAHRRSVRAACWRPHSENRNRCRPRA